MSAPTKVNLLSPDRSARTCWYQLVLRGWRLHTQAFRNSDFLAFLRLIDKSIDKALAVHIIADNYGTHKHPNVRDWLTKHPLFHMHFVPTSSSWLDLVERWFRDLTGKRLRRGSFLSVAELISAIEDYITHNNSDPTPYKWKKTAEQILEKVKRGRWRWSKRARYSGHYTRSWPPRRHRCLSSAFSTPTADISLGSMASGSAAPGTPDGRFVRAFPQ